MVKWLQRSETSGAYLVTYRNLLRERSFVLRSLVLGQVWDMPPNLRLAPQEEELILSLPENAGAYKELQGLTAKARAPLPLDAGETVY